jgi:7-cyano-7-deazaguanine synthase
MQHLTEMSTDKPKAVVLMSGGMDSCVTAAVASRTYQVAALHASYGQRTERRELQCFHQLADHFGAFTRLAVRLDHFTAIGGSSLTDTRLPVHDADLANTAVPNTYVPFRNAHFLSIAVSWAEVLGAKKIFIGAVWEDSSGYPDCRPEYYDAFNKLIRLGTRPETDVSVETPLIHRSKREIVQLGVQLAAPLQWTWSCYRDSDLACGVCDSCALRLRAFQQAGLDDPIAYASKPEYARVS